MSSVGEQMGETVKGVNGEVTTEPGEMRKKWSEYYEELLNIEDGKEAVVTYLNRGGVRDGRGMEVDDVRREEVTKAL